MREPRSGRHPINVGDAEWAAVGPPPSFGDFAHRDTERPKRKPRLLACVV
jgi:hypothetical protein